MPVETNPDKDYFYLGVPALLGLIFLIRRRRFRDLAPPVAILAVTLMVAGNPYDIVWNVIRHSTSVAGHRSLLVLSGRSDAGVRTADGVRSG